MEITTEVSLAQEPLRQAAQQEAVGTQERTHRLRSDTACGAAWGQLWTEHQMDILTGTSGVQPETSPGLCQIAEWALQKGPTLGLPGLT